MSEKIFNPYQVDSTAEYNQGERGTNPDGHEFVYVKATAAITTGHVVGFGETAEAAPVTSAYSKGNRIGVAVTAIPINHFGWVSIYGSGNILVQVSVARAQLYTSATAGYLDDTSTGSPATINGIVLTVARTGTAGAQAAIWTFPVVG